MQRAELDPAVRAYLEAGSHARPIEQLSPAEARAAVANAVRSADAEVFRVADLTGPLPMRLYANSDAPNLPTLLYFHGGGWVVGDIDTHDHVARRLAAYTGCAVISVGYRLAPEHRYPAAVEDAWLAARWCVEQGTRLGVDPTRLIVAGDSAGGNLAAVLALRARENGAGFLLQVLINPVTDCDLSRDSYRTNGEGYGLTAAAMSWYWDQYLPDAAARRDPTASPLRARDLHGAAPALVVLSDHDPLFDEGLAYAMRLRAAGVEVTVVICEGMIHGVIRLDLAIAGTRNVFETIGASVKAAVGAQIGLISNEGVDMSTRNPGPVRAATDKHVRTGDRANERGGLQ